MTVSHRSVVFGVPVHGVSSDVALLRIETHQRTWIVTANPEILLAARQDPTYAETLRSADLVLADGVGLWAALRLSGSDAVRVAGVDLAEAIFLMAIQRNWKIALIGGGPGVAEQAARVWQKKFSEARILAEGCGMIHRDGTDDTQGAQARKRLAAFCPQVVFVAFGHPKQEQWIKRFQHIFCDARVMIGVGGVFDLWAGVHARAPRLMQRFGLEWLWRLFLEPKRYRRIWRAVVVFPYCWLRDFFYV